MTKIEAAFNAAADYAPDADAVARELAKLSPLAYDQRRKEEAKRLNVQVRTLDATVRRYRSGEDGDTETGSPFTDPEPWPEPVDGAALLDEMAETFRRFVVLPDHSADAMALWCIHAHAHDAADISPILAILSPTMRCGKTTTVKVISALVPKPMHAVNISPSVLFRVVEKYAPTVLVDEGDSFLRDNEDMRGILNGGHDRMSAYVWRSVGDDHEPKQFKVWAPKTIAMIGRLADTLQDRSVVVPLRRRRDDETVERFRAERVSELAPLLSKAARWAADHHIGIAGRNPDLPNDMDDRAQDNWRILVAIADEAAGQWPETARAAAVALSREDTRGDTMPAGVRLLRDMQTIMDGRDEIGSSALIEKLVCVEDASWGEWRHGKPLTTHGAARLLKPYGVKPYRGSGASVYRAEDLADAWSRYLEKSVCAAPETECESANCEQSATKNINENNDSRTFALSRTCGEARTSKVRDADDVPDGPQKYTETF